MNDDLETLMKELEKFHPARLPSVLERCVMVARAKRLYQEEHPETCPGGDRRSGIRRNRPPRFSAYCAQVMGKSEKAVSYDAQVGNGLSQAAYVLLRSTPIADNQSALMELAALDGAEQLAVAYMIAKEGVASVGDALDMVSTAASEYDQHKPAKGKVCP